VEYSASLFIILRINNPMPTTTDIPTELIERALGLTGKTRGDMEEVFDEIDVNTNSSLYRAFSYPKFYAYLLSEDFIEKYIEKQFFTLYYMEC